MNQAKFIAKKFPSPLRYPGGKSSLKHFMGDLLLENGIKGIYCEAYAGGAGAALGLLTEGKVEQIVLNDADPHIFAFWNSLLMNSERFINELERTEITIEEWENHKYIYDNPEEFSEFELGFSTFFLNRSNRGGILPKAGPTGGMSQKGNYKINARFRKENLIPRIRKINELKDRIMFYNLDALNFLSEVATNLDINNTLIYLDPPYYEQGKNLYLNFYTHKDHSNLASFLENLEHFKWIVSYDKVAEIEQLYENYRKINFDINYSVQNARLGSEIMYFSNSVIVPKQFKINNKEYPIIL